MAHQGDGAETRHVRSQGDCSREAGHLCSHRGRNAASPVVGTVYAPPRSHRGSKRATPFSENGRRCDATRDPRDGNQFFDLTRAKGGSRDASGPKISGSANRARRRNDRRQYPPRLPRRRVNHLTPPSRSSPDSAVCRCSGPAARRCDTTRAGGGCSRAPRRRGDGSRAVRGRGRRSGRHRSGRR